MIKETEIHLIKGVICLEKVKLNVNFSGQLSFEFKNIINPFNRGLICEKIPKKYPLIKNQCLVNQNIQFQVQASYNKQNKQYNQVIVDLIIYINTTNNKMVVGTISINVARENYLNLPLKKCPDQLACINLSIIHSKVHFLKHMEQTLIKSKLNKSAIIISKMDVSLPLLQINKSKVDIKNQLYNKISKTSRSSRLQKHSISPVHRLSPNILMKQSKIQQIEEKDKYKNGQLYKQSSEVQLLNIHQKLRLSQRRQKAIQYQLDEVKSIADKRRLEIIQLYIQLNQLHKYKEQSQKKIKVNQIQQQQRKKQYQQLLFKVSFFQKVSESKNQMNRVRKEKLQQKIKQLQSQNTKITHDYSSLLHYVQELSKSRLKNANYRSHNFDDQKDKMKQLIEKLQSQPQQYKQQVGQLLLQKNQLISQQQTANIIKINNLQAKCQQTRFFNECLKIRQQNQQLARKQLQENKYDYPLVINNHNQQQNLKKILQKATDENTQLKQKMHQYKLNIIGYQQAVKTQLISLSNKQQQIISLQQTILHRQSIKNQLVRQQQNASTNLRHSKVHFGNSVQYYKLKCIKLQQCLVNQFKRFDQIQLVLNEQNDKLEVKQLQCHKLSIKIQQITSENNYLRTEVQEKNMQIKGLNKNIDDLNNLLYLSKKQRKDLYNEKKIIQDQLHSKQSKNCQLRFKQKAGRNIVIELNNKLQDTQEYIIHVMGKSISIYQSFSQQNGNLNQQKGRQSYRQTFLAKNNRKNKNLAAILHQHEIDGYNKYSLIKQQFQLKHSLQLNTQIKDLKQQENETKSLKDYINKLKDYIIKIMNNYDNQIQQCLDQLQNLENNIDEMQEQLKRQSYTIINLQKDKSKLQDKIVCLNRIIKQLKDIPFQSKFQQIQQVLIKGTIIKGQNYEVNEERKR